MNAPACGNCYYWRRQEHTLSKIAGHCHRHAPVTIWVDNGPDDRGYGNQWPFVNEDDWCGEYERGKA